VKPSTVQGIDRPKAASVAAADYIRREIFSGSYAPDTRVPQDQVALALDISRIPVREALVTLHGEGYVRLEANRGAVVVPFYAEDLRSFFKMRGFCLALAAQQCARMDDASLIGHLRTLIALADGSDSADEFSVHSEAFSNQIADSGGSPRLRAAIARFRNIVPGNFFAEVAGTRGVESECMHRVTDAIEQHDVDAIIPSYVARAHEHAERLIALLAERGQLCEPEPGQPASTRTGRPSSQPAMSATTSRK
jgi:DNA-binding GntR family transcriptional regulator